MSHRVDRHRPQPHPKPKAADAPPPRAQSAAKRAEPARAQAASASSNKAEAAKLVQQLRSNPNFQKLPRGIQARVLATAKRYGGNAQARQNIATAALDPDFRKLKPAQQKEAVRTLRAAVKQRGVGKNLSQLASDKDFRHLGAKEQRNVLQGLRENKTDAAARKGLVNLADSSGFGKVSARLQDQFIDGVSRPQKGNKEAQFANDARQLVSDGDFRRLGQSTQSLIATRLSPQANVPRDTRDQLVELSTQPGLERLTPEVQAKVVNGLRPVGSGSEEWQRNQNLVDLVHQPNFGFLPADLQNKSVDAIIDPRVTPERAGVLAEAIGSPGFRRLDRATQDSLFRFANGADKFTGAINDRLGQIVYGDAFQNGSADAQAGLLRSTLAKPFPANVPNVADNPRPFSISGPSEAPGTSFPSGAQDALRYDVNVDGRSIPVYISKDQDPARGSYNTIDQIAHSLANLPASSLALVTDVRLDGRPNPTDAHFAEIYGRPDFRAYMTAGANGSIDVYPSAGPVPQEEINTVMVHETGHTLSFRSWGNDTNDPRWDAWKNAIATDAAGPSDYATSAPSEDFSEALATYMAVRGTPDEAAARSLMPGRFALIDDLLSRPPPPNPYAATA